MQFRISNIKSSKVSAANKQGENPPPAPTQQKRKATVRTQSEIAEQSNSLKTSTSPIRCYNADK